MKKLIHLIIITLLSVNTVISQNKEPFFKSTMLNGGLLLSKKGSFVSSFYGPIHRGKIFGGGVGGVFTTTRKSAEDYIAIGEKKGIALLLYINCQQFQQYIWEGFLPYIYVGIAYAGTVTLEPLEVKDFDRYLFTTIDFKAIIIGLISIKPRIATALYPGETFSVYSSITFHYNDYWLSREFLGVGLGFKPMNENKSPNGISYHISLFNDLLQIGQIKDLATKSKSVIFISFRPVFF